MATGLKFYDGFDHYKNNDTTADASPHALWFVPEYGETSAILQARTDASRHTSGKGMAIGYNRSAGYAFGSAYSEVILGCAFQYKATATFFVLYALMDGTTQASEQFTLTFETATKTFKAYRGTHAGTLLGTSSAVPYSLETAFGYVELKVKIHNSTGYVVVRFNGTEVLNLTSQNTRGATSNDQATAVALGRNGYISSSGMIVDDFYFADATVSGAAFLGDVRIESRTVTATAGNYTAWTASAGNKNECIDDDGSDADGTYISETTATNKVTYQLQDPSQQAGNVYAVGTLHRSRKDDGGTRTIRSLLRLSGTDATGTSYNVGTTYVSYFDHFETDPSGGAWSISDLNNLEGGVDLVA